MIVCHEHMMAMILAFYILTMQRCRVRRILTCSYKMKCGSRKRIIVHGKHVIARSRFLITF